MTHNEDRTFHVGLIMDGNGRWAEARGMSRIAGHARGARRVSEIVRACPDLGVTHLTLYAFSTENWARPLAEVEALMAALEERTRDGDGLTLSIAIDYGGRDELTRAVRALSREVACGSLPPAAISEAALAGALDTRGLPDPDFIIRTSGEFRVSNFLLWQAVYAEYDFPEVAWPDFTVGHFAAAVDGFRLRQRRFGAVEAPAAAAESITLSSYDTRAG